MLCPNCNKEIPDKSKYCIKCGQRIHHGKQQGAKDESLNDESYRLLSTIIATTAGASSREEAVSALLKRGNIFLEDGDWKAAAAYFDRALDSDPECAFAYMGKLCAELQVHTEPEIQQLLTPLSGNCNYEKALRYADPDYKSKLEKYNESILNRIEEIRRAQIYTAAKESMGQGQQLQEDRPDEIPTSVELLRRAAEDFRSISGYRDADALAENCDSVINQLLREEALREEENLRRQQAEEIERQRVAKKRKKLALIITPPILLGITVVLCLVYVIIPAKNYNQAVSYLEAGKYSEALAIFEELGDYKDAKERISEVYYNQALSYLEGGKYGEALSIFEELGDYKDAKEHISEAYYYLALSYLETGEYSEALSIFEELGDYKDAKERIPEAYYNLATSYLEAGEYSKALSSFKSAGDYKDAKERISEAYYNLALSYLETGKQSMAQQLFELAGDYKDAQERILTITANALSGNGSKKDEYTDIPASTTSAISAQDFVGMYIYDVSFTDPSGLWVNFCYILNIEWMSSGLVVTYTWRGNHIFDHVWVNPDTLIEDTLTFVTESDTGTESHSLTYLPSKNSAWGNDVIYIDGNEEMPFVRE